MASPISPVPTAFAPGPAMSFVRVPEASTAGDRPLEQVGLLAEAERIAQRHAERADHGDRVGEAASGDVRRRAVHRLVERLALAGLRVLGAERGRGQHAERAGQHRRDVGEDVAEQVVGDDHVVLLRTAHELHGAVVGEHVLELDVGNSALWMRVTTWRHSTPDLHDVALLGRRRPCRGACRARSKATRAMRSISPVV